LRKVALLGLLIFLVFLEGPGKSEILPLNSAVTQRTIQNTICVRGWTASVRPPVSYTNRIKKLRMQEMGLPLELIGNFTLDHKIPISLGGSPDDPRNLILQDHDEAQSKDIVERCLPVVVCKGGITLDEAQETGTVLRASVLIALIGIGETNHETTSNSHPSINFITGKCFWDLLAILHRNNRVG
jgi:hypothetical protein